VQVENLTVQHITNSPTSGGDGIVVSNGTTNVLLNYVHGISNWNGANLGYTTYGEVNNSFFEFNNNDGLIITTSQSSPVYQWQMYGDAFDQNASDGMNMTLGSGIASLQVTGPSNLNGSSAYGNGRYGFAFSGSAATSSGIADVWMNGDFSTSNGNSNFYFDPGPAGGRNFKITGGYAEQAGGLSVASGFAQTSPSATHVGYGVEITASCDPTTAPLIVGITLWQNSYSGGMSLCPGTTWVGAAAFDNGFATSSNAYQRAGISLRANNQSVTGGWFGTGGTDQTSGVEVSNSANIISGDINCAASLTTCVLLTTTPTIGSISTPQSHQNGKCTMSSGTSCTFSIGASFASTPNCQVTVQGTTAIAGACSVSGTTVTITAASSNSATWAARVGSN
jgi:hypothetical protein